MFDTYESLHDGAYDCRNSRVAKMHRFDSYQRAAAVTSGVATGGTDKVKLVDDNLLSSKTTSMFDTEEAEQEREVRNNYNDTTK